MSLQSTASEKSFISKDKQDIFQDLPLLDKHTRLTVIELKQSDKQIVNELVYRWCRVITRSSRKSLELLISQPADASLKDFRKVLIIDMVGSINPIRLATVMKRDEGRMRMIGIARGCKINSTYVTLNSYLGQPMSLSNSLKLVVVYHDEFFISRTLTLLKNCLKTIKCQVLLVAPRLDRPELDLLSLISNYQLLKCDFCVNRRDIGPAPPESTSDSYQSYLNQFYFQRSPPNKALPDKVLGELREDGLHLDATKQLLPPPRPQEKGSSLKRMRLDS